MNRFFRCFCTNRFSMGPLHFQSSRSDFGLEFSEIFLIEKRLPASVSQQDCLDLPFFQTFRLINCDSKLHPWHIFCQICHLKAWCNRLKFWKSKSTLKNFFSKSDSLHQRYAESTTPRITDVGSWRLSVSVRRGVDDSVYRWYGEFFKKYLDSDSPSHRYGESATHHITDTRSCRLPVSPIRGVADSPYHRCRESATLRIIYMGSRRLPISLIAGSRFSNTNISANSRPKSERLEGYCKGPMPNRFMQKHRKNWFIAMSL
jgi:hypothetical protein